MKTYHAVMYRPDKCLALLTIKEIPGWSEMFDQQRSIDNFPGCLWAAINDVCKSEAQVTLTILEEPKWPTTFALPKFSPDDFASFAHLCAGTCRAIEPLQS